MVSPHNTRQAEAKTVSAAKEDGPGQIPSVNSRLSMDLEVGELCVIKRLRKMSHSCETPDNHRRHPLTITANHHQRPPSIVSDTINGSSCEKKKKMTFAIRTKLEVRDRMCKFGKSQKKNIDTRPLEHGTQGLLEGTGINDSVAMCTSNGIKWKNRC